MLRLSLINVKINSVKRAFEIITMLRTLIVSDVTNVKHHVQIHS